LLKTSRDYKNKDKSVFLLPVKLASLSRLKDGSSRSSVIDSVVDTLDLETVLLPKTDL
jgi:hypothetical protein